MNKSKYLLKNMGLLSISNFSSKILVFLLVPLYTSALSTTEYGAYDLIISSISLFYPILTLNVADAVMRFSMDKSYSEDKVAIIGIKSVSFSIVIAILILFILDKSGIWKDWKIYIFLYYLSYAFNQFFIQFAKGIEKVSDMAIAGVIGTLSMIIFNLLFLLVFRFGLVGFFIANILSQSFPAVYFFFRLRFWKYISVWDTDKNLRKEMFLYCIPLIITTLGWWINNTLDKYAVVLICGIAANGILSVSYKIPQIINTIQGIFVQAWQISAIKEYGENDTAKFYGSIFSVINMLMCTVCAWLILLTRPLAHILYAKDFYIAWQYVPFLLISSVLNCSSGLLGSILSAKKDTKSMMWSAIIGSGVNAFLNFLLIHLINIQGATIATFLSSIVIYVIRRIAVSQDIIIKDYYYITWSLLIIQTIMEIWTRNIWIQIILMFVMLIVNRKNILLIIEEIINKNI